MTDVFAIQRLLARYTRCADRRDGIALAQLFAPDATIEVIYDKGEVPEVLGALSGREAIGAAMSAMMQPHPPGIGVAPFRWTPMMLSHEVFRYAQDTPALRAGVPATDGRSGPSWP